MTWVLLKKKNALLCIRDRFKWDDMPFFKKKNVREDVCSHTYRAFLSKKKNGKGGYLLTAKLV
jgi:hypothetical protein